MTDSPFRSRLLLFEPNAGGHHAGYVGHLLQAWHDRGIAGRLVAAVSPALFADRPDLRALAGPTGAGEVVIAELPDAASLVGKPLLAKGWAERSILRDAIAAQRPERALAMFGDHTQLALLPGFRPAVPTRLSLLLLRVSHHRDAPASLGGRLQQARKRALLSLAARSSHAGPFLSSDPAAVEALRALGAESAYVPDPVLLPTCAPDLAAVRADYGVTPGRTLHVVYGALAERKGVLTVLDALPLLPPDVAARTTVLFAGPVLPDLQDRLGPRIEAARAATEVEVLLRDAYLDETQSCELFAAADVILAPYLGHAGTSSVLIRAAGAGVPIVSQARGLMAEQVRAHALGRTADAADPAAVARAMAAPLADGFDAARARAFAASQTPEAYARATFDALGLS